MRAALLVSALTVFAAIGASTVPAQAQSRQELDARVTALEQRLATPPPQDAAMRNLDRINSLEEQLRVLTGQIEELQFQNRQLQDRVDTLNEDMMSAMSRQPLGGAPFDAEPGFEPGLEPDGPTALRPAPGETDDFAIIDESDPFAAERRAATRPLGAGGADAGDSAVSPAAAGLDQNYQRTGDDPDLLFNRGRTRLLDGDFSAAMDAFAEFLDVAPDHARAGEAWFWIGSIYRTEAQPIEAADAMVKYLETEPDGVYAPEAMVHLGASLVEIGEQDEGCRTLARVAQDYPEMDSATRSLAGRKAREAGCS
jgi:TolA-binding protein